MERAQNAGDLAETRDRHDVIAMLRMLRWAEKEMTAMDAPRSAAMLRNCQESLPTETGFTE